MNIAIIGGGWYGCHLALALKKAGHKVTIFEKNKDILNEVSGNFGIRLHKGPHYPRSPATRESCHQAFDEFCNTYPDFVVHHEYSIYALGEVDALGNPSKVTREQFEQVCHESPDCKKVDAESLGYKGLQTAMSLDEPSVIIGEELRVRFRRMLEEAGVNIRCETLVQDLQSDANGTVITDEHGFEHRFDYTINASGYQSFIPTEAQNNFPVEMEIVYQPCLGLKYKDRKPTKKPFSFIVMDGWYPCIMPCVEKATFQGDYILTHGAYTIMASCKTASEAHAVLNKLTDDFVEKNIRSRAASEMARFWPEFAERFEYQGYKKAVLAKIKTKNEFRSAVTFGTGRVLHVIPGKLNNVFSAEREINALLESKDCLLENGIHFMKNGILDQARVEIQTKPDKGEPNTCNLQTFADIKKAQDAAKNGIFSTKAEMDMDAGKKHAYSPHSFFHYVPSIPSRCSSPKIVGTCQ